MSFKIETDSDGGTQITIDGLMQITIDADSMRAEIVRAPKAQFNFNYDEDDDLLSISARNKLADLAFVAPEFRDEWLRLKGL